MGRSSLNKIAQIHNRQRQFYASLKECVAIHAYHLVHLFPFNAVTNFMSSNLLCAGRDN